MCTAVSIFACDLLVDPILQGTGGAAKSASSNPSQKATQPAAAVGQARSLRSAALEVKQLPPYQR